MLNLKSTNINLSNFHKENNFKQCSKKQSSVIEKYNQKAIRTRSHLKTEDSLNKQKIPTSNKSTMETHKIFFSFHDTKNNSKGQKHN